ncbi:MAG TPA: class I SAM-dependent methyltransferase [Pyrinomonadaceae bacterium]|nr:class I SAM-dependent methyltransferase [Pyrinomonadaceae bacterium]
MTVDLSGLPIFYEALEPERPTRFDRDMDEWAKRDAQEKGVVAGVCNVAGAEAEFRIASDNFREDLMAEGYGTINRHRQVVCALSLSIFSHPHATLSEIAAYINSRKLKVYSAEAHSPLFRYLSEYLEPELFVCSEYFGAEHRSGDVVGEVLHQDLQRTSFADGEFDIVLTFEVFEHIPDALVAEREVVRILKAGGIYCFTVPFLPESEHDLVLAELDEAGEIKHYAEPQYHGDPVRPEEGILVYRLFSYHDLRRRFEELNCAFKSYRLWSKALGILDDNGWVHVATKASDDTSTATGVSALAAQTSGDDATTATAMAQELAYAQARLAALQAHLRRHDIAVGEMREQGVSEEETIQSLHAKLINAREELAATEARLEKSVEVAEWVQTSRSWRLLAGLRNTLEVSAPARLVRRLRHPLGTSWQGALESPVEGATLEDAGELEVVGWVFSAGTPVKRVEAFLDSTYLGRVRYGLEREDVAESHTEYSLLNCGFAERFTLPAAHAGRRTLLVRAFDARGRRHIFTRTLSIES